jgi:hypothetical protein
MKSTKIMLAALCTLLCTWTLFATIVWMFSDLTFKQSYVTHGVLLCMLILGWIPSVIVGVDLEDHLD